MKKLLIFLATTSLLCPSTQAGIGEDLRFTSKVINQTFFKMQYRYKGHENYSFEPCKRYDGQASSYYITCQNNEFSSIDNMELLARDMHAITTNSFEQKMLEELKIQMLKKMQDRLEEVQSIEYCLGTASTTDECKKIKQDLLNYTREKLPKVRSLMAQMNLPALVYSPEANKRYRIDALTHPLSNIKTKPLTKKEIHFMKKHSKAMENIIRQRVLSGNIDYPINNNNQEFSDCLVQNNKGLLSLSTKKECEKYDVIISYRMDIESDKQSKIYLNQYYQEVNKNPLLTLLKISGEESDEEILNNIRGSLGTLKQSIMSLSNRVESYENRDRFRLLAFNEGVADFIKKKGATRQICDAAENMLEDHELREFAEDAIIASITVPLGIACGSNLLCGVAVVASGESLILSLAQNRHMRSKDALYSSLSSQDNSAQIKQQRDIALYLAPLAFIGVSNTSSLKRGISSAEDYEKQVRDLYLDSFENTYPKRNDKLQRSLIQEITDEISPTEQSFLLAKYLKGDEKYLSRTDKFYMAAIIDQLQNKALKKHASSLSDSLTPEKKVAIESKIHHEVQAEVNLKLKRCNSK